MNGHSIGGKQAKQESLEKLKSNLRDIYIQYRDLSSRCLIDISQCGRNSPC